MTIRNGAFSQDRRRQHAAAHSAIETANTQQRIQPSELQTVVEEYVRPARRRSYGVSLFWK
ncbi:hypothetical protein M422DRAFT_29027 [Sphaerobolus stellatus SS14]|uniref:Unplaced genomic scaffold SPHSTscaffold_29, whole genome shotgun sequence n=1 Tax=Sphaerobolus stellatus (strain SS14) TaxID=990650 RepID=A0A0C9VII1_SPHS4|nr:hypothetical protein M422DRAFT_29027 [Sphaerobolus stellatus SS14]